MGDPVWLPDVLRAAGLNVRVHQPHGDCGGAFENGHGDFGDIWGMMFHHTGSFGETENGIAHHPSLGLCSQCLVTRDGTWIVCGVGIAYHAGLGSYPGVPTNDGNRVLLGVEVAHDGGGRPGLPHRSVWSDVQYNSVVTGFAACLKHLGRTADRAIAHKEYAGASQGKWDPGAIDMNVFRLDVAAAMRRGGSTGGGPVADEGNGWGTRIVNLTGDRVSREDILKYVDLHVGELLDQFGGLGTKRDDPEHRWKGWPQLNGQTVVNALADIGQALGLPGYGRQK